MVTIEREYVPGACNIGPAESKRRLATGWVGTALTVVVEGLFWVWGVSPVWRLFLFFPAALAATGFLQAAMHFCAGYGMKGVFNVAAPVGQTQAVGATEAQAKDRAKAQQIFGLSVAIGLAVALAAFFSASAFLV